MNRPKIFKLIGKRIQPGKVTNEDILLVLNRMDHALHAKLDSIVEEFKSRRVESMPKPKPGVQPIYEQVDEFGRPFNTPKK